MADKAQGSSSAAAAFERVIDDEGGAAHYTFDFEYDKEKSGQESKKKYLSRVKSTLRIVLQVR